MTLLAFFKVVGGSSKSNTMKKTILVAAIAFGVARAGFGSQADDTTVNIAGQAAGATPFISKVTLNVSDLSALQRVQFRIQSKGASVVRPFSAIYSKQYLANHDNVDQAGGKVTVPVFGLYDGFNNTVTLTYFFSDGSSKSATLHITTQPFDITPCPFDTPAVLKARTNNTGLSYDYFVVASQCNNNSPTILDTDGAVRWVGTAGVKTSTTTFYDNAIYIHDGPKLLRNDFDGSVTLVADLTGQEVVDIHHNMDAGRDGLILEVDTQTYLESELMEVNARSGEVLNHWDFGKIISDAMRAKGEDPSTFVKPANGDYSFSSPGDWFHNNAHWYRKKDDSLLVSSRENFIITVDYDTHDIKWIFGDRSKDWFVNHPSLQQFAITPGPDTQGPDGEHAISITDNDQLLLFDNGQQSQHHNPPGPNRASAARRYAFDLPHDTITQVWQYPNPADIFSPFCSSIYEDDPYNYLVDYAVLGGVGANSLAEIYGLDADGKKVFDYQYPSPATCGVAYRSIPIHLERLVFEANTAINVQSSNLQLANISSRVYVRGGDDVAIAGFIIRGNEPKHVVIRALGPSLPFPSSDVINDPTLQLFDANGTLIERNNNYGDGPRVDAIRAAGLIPKDNRESAIERELAPGKYTAFVQGLNKSAGLALIEVYDTSPATDSKLGNISTRAFVGTDEKVLIGGVIVAGSFPKNVLFRAIGPELTARGVHNALQNPTLGLFNVNGAMIASNDDWGSAPNAGQITASGLAPTDPREAAILKPLTAGKYTAIVRGKAESTGTALVEAFQLEK